MQLYGEPQLQLFWKYGLSSQFTQLIVPVISQFLQLMLPQLAYPEQLPFEQLPWVVFLKYAVPYNTFIPVVLPGVNNPLEF